MWTLWTGQWRRRIFANVPLVPSRSPLIAGLTAAGLGVLGLFANAAAILVITFAVSRFDTFTPSMLLALLDLAMGVALLVAGVLILLKRDAGRSAAVWISASTLPWAILTVVGTTAAARTSAVERSLSWAIPITIVGTAGGGLGVLALILAMIFLGIPSGRHWLASIVLARPGRPPLPSTKARFLLAMIVGVGGVIALLAMLPFVALGQETWIGVLAIVFGAILFVFVVVPVGLGLAGGTFARNGKRGGATLARVAGGFAAFGFPVFTVLTLFVTFASVSESTRVRAVAPLSPAATLVVGSLVALASLVGWAFFVAGLAGLADPRSEQFYRERNGRSELPAQQVPLPYEPGERPQAYEQQYVMYPGPPSGVAPAPHGQHHGHSPQQHHQYWHGQQ
jgi:hypothetical protein